MQVNVCGQASEVLPESQGWRGSYACYGGAWVKYSFVRTDQLRTLTAGKRQRCSCQPTFYATRSALCDMVRVP